MVRNPARLAALSCAAAIAACSGGGGSEGPGYTVTVQPSSAALCVGDSQAFTAQVLDGSGRPVSGAVPAWSSGSPQVASIDPTRGVARALTTGSSTIVATYSGARSPAATLEVPTDLVPQFVPDSIVLAPGDTMTLGVRLRRTSNGPVPAHVPLITPNVDTSVAKLSASGLVTAKAAGRASFTLAACGAQGSGAADVYSPPDSVTGVSYLWLSGPKEVRARLPARAINFTRTNGRPAVEIGDSGVKALAYVDSAAVTGSAILPLDSLNSSELVAKLQCQPPRPFATYSDATSLTQPTALFSLQGGTALIASYVARTGYAAVSGRMIFRMRGIVNGQLGSGGSPDTLSAIYTFSVPLVAWTNACP